MIIELTNEERAIIRAGLRAHRNNIIDSLGGDSRDDWEHSEIKRTEAILEKMTHEGESI